MATIAQTTLTGVEGPLHLTRTVLTASDTLTYLRGAKQVLTLVNSTGADVTITITGSVKPNVPVPGYVGTVSTASGKTVLVEDGTTVAIQLDTIYAFLQGTVSITGGTGLVATLSV